MNISLVFRIMGWHGNKELDDIETKMTKKRKKEPHCVKCEHLGMLRAVFRNVFRGGSRISGKGVHMYKGVWGSLC